MKKLMIQYGLYAFVTLGLILGLYFGYVQENAYQQGIRNITYTLAWVNILMMLFASGIYVIVIGTDNETKLLDVIGRKRFMAWLDITIDGLIAFGFIFFGGIFTGSAMLLSVLILNFLYKLLRHGDAVARGDA